MRGASEMHLLNITVAPSARRQGHARVLLDALVDECRALEAERLWLEVRLANLDAQRTYLRLGFIKVGVRKGYYPAPGGAREDAVVMSRIVEPAAGGADALE
jgi:ribosomal-protein-alanine N-acetyltransferase